MNARPSFNGARDFLLGEGRARQTVIEAVSRLDGLALEAGILFRPSFNPADLDDADAPLNQRYTSGRLTSRNFVGISGNFFGGETRQAIRLYNWYDGATLASESRALRVYYDHPDDAEHTEHAIIAAPIADRIHGRVCFNGAVWVAPDMRGPRPELGGVFVSQIVSALSRMFALYLFDPDWCIATTPEDHFLKGTSERYGWAGIADPCHVENIGNGPVKVRLMWSRREDMLAEAERIASEGLRAPE